jgi:hypothetical protein
MAYFYGQTGASNWINGNTCLTKEQIIKNVGENGVVLNSDGTVSVFYNNPRLGLYPVKINLECCKVLDPTYYFDIDTQTCRWAKPHETCGFNEPINLIINPKGDDGTLFFIDEFEKEKCDLKISFDYLLKIKCEDLLNIVNPTISTNTQSQETIKQIVNLQMEIGVTNSLIEEISNQVILLNGEYEKTPYSIQCDQFPVETTGPCVRPPNLPEVTLWYGVDVGYTGTTNFTSSYDTACKATTSYGNPKARFNGSSNNVTKFEVGGTVYFGINKTTCDLRNNGYYITNLPKREITHIFNGEIKSIGVCPTTDNPSPIVFEAGFDNSGFSSPTEIESFDNLASRAYISETFTSVNFCLTDAGLAVWASILGANNYQLFIQGDINNPGYTCADVITLTKQNNASDLFYECTTPFNTKSEIWTKITKLMTELSVLNTTITNQQNELIVLQNTFVTTTASTKGCNTMIDALESLDIEMHLDVVNADNTIKSVFSAATFPAINSTTNLYEYLVENPNSGFYICGDPSKDNVGFSDCTVLTLDNNAPNVDSCGSIIDDLVDGLIKESGSNINNISKSAFTSNWLSYTKVINDPEIIDLITNKKIKISFKIKFSCVDFCLLLDNIVLDKTCKSVDRNDITISQNPGFELKRVIDNKKSWVDTTSPTNREFLISKSNGTNPIRQTDYDVNDERLVINSKEIDLDISVASAIETDMWCYLNDNPCLLSGATVCDITYPINTTTFLGADVVLLDETVGQYDLEDYETCYQSLRNGWLNAIDDSILSGSDVPMREWLADNLVIENISCGRLFKFNCAGFIFLEKDYGCTDLYAETQLGFFSKFYDEPMSNFINIFIKDYNNAISSIVTIEETFILKNNCSELSNITYPINTTTFLGDEVVLLEESIGYNDITDFFGCHRTCINELRKNFFSGKLTEWLDDNLEIENISDGRLFKFETCDFIFLEKDYGCTDLYSKEYSDDIVYLNKILDTGLRYLEMRNFINTFITDFNSYIIPSNIDNKYILKNNCPDLCYKKCGDYNLNFNELISEPISGVTTIGQFENLMVSEFIDVKNRQTITSYPTLRAIYDRYLNSSDYCSTVSSAFDYQNMDKFAGLIGDYWVDLIEQVVPSTTIWGSVKIYTNTIFDEQKFKYKSYSSLLCNNPFYGQKVLSPINGLSGENKGVSVIYKDLLAQVKTNTNDSLTTNLAGEIVMNSSESNQVISPFFDLEDYPPTKPNINTCDNLHIVQMNSGSEFISYINMPEEPGCEYNVYKSQSNIQECNLKIKINSVNIDVSNRKLETITVGGTTPFTYLWSNGETTKTITVPITGNTTYSVTVTDANCCTVKAQAWDYFYNRS